MLLLLFSLFTSFPRYIKLEAPPWGDMMGVWGAQKGGMMLKETGAWVFKFMSVGLMAGFPGDVLPRQVQGLAEELKLLGCRVVIWGIIMAGCAICIISHSAVEVPPLLRPLALLLPRLALLDWAPGKSKRKH